MDIAVYLADNLYFKDDKLNILGNLMKILQTDEIDLIILNAASLPMIINVLKNKRIIFDKDPFARHIFESLSMRKYFDFSVKEAELLKRRYFHG